MFKNKDDFVIVCDWCLTVEIDTGERDPKSANYLAEIAGWSVSPKAIKQKSIHVCPKCESEQ